MKNTESGGGEDPPGQAICKGFCKTSRTVETGGERWEGGKRRELKKKGRKHPSHRVSEEKSKGNQEAGVSRREKDITLERSLPTSEKKRGEQTSRDRKEKKRDI